MNKKNIAFQIKSITKEDAINDYKKLEKVDVNEIKPNDRIGNKFVDYFTFLERLNTTGSKGMNFFEFFHRKDEFEKRRYIRRLLMYSKKHGTKNLYKMWYGVFNLYFNSINIFKPLLAMEIYNMFKPHSVLDPTMGWGGRLVGACVMDVPEYIGIDLNKNLEKPYKDMIKQLKELGTDTNIKVYFKDCLKVDYSKFKYDMVFTSPPYYNVEIYNGTTKMSKDEWDENFYKPLITKTFNHLQKGGIYCFNVPNEVYERVCIPLLGKADKFIPLKITKRGSSSSKTGNKININYGEFIYVWKK